MYGGIVGILFLDLVEFITKIISGREPDFDLSYMSKSKYFVQSGGGFSRIIADLVKVNNGIVLN